MNKFVQVIFTEEEWKWLEHHMAELPENDIIMRVISALDDACEYEED